MSLELKIPPVFVAIIAAVMMWLCALFTPNLAVIDAVRTVLVIAGLLLGSFFAVSGVVSFKTADTTVNPTKPETSSALVTSGIYQRTRNPMYVGMAFWLLAWSAYLSNLFTIVFVVSFIVYMTKYQIKPEEKALTNIFGEEYLDFMNKVKRWL